MEKVYIELTDEQKEKLIPLFDEVLNRSHDKPVMLLAQIHFNGMGDAGASCGIIDHNKALKLQKIMNAKSVGQTSGTEAVEKVLELARSNR